jgi:hypothetical protein
MFLDKAERLPNERLEALNREIGKRLELLDRSGGIDAEEVRARLKRKSDARRKQAR